MIPIYLSWTIGSGRGCHAGNNREPAVSEILEIMHEIAKQSGCINLEIIDSPEIGVQNLQIRSENNYFLVMLGENEEDDHNVRTYTNLSVTSQRVEILGDFWDSRIICTQYEIVIKILIEFLETGDVSKNLLN